LDTLVGEGKKTAELSNSTTLSVRASPGETSQTPWVNGRAAGRPPAPGLKKTKAAMNTVSPQSKAVRVSGGSRPPVRLRMVESAPMLSDRAVAPRP